MKFNFLNIIIVFISVLTGLFLIELAFYYNNAKKNEYSIFDKFEELEKKQLKPVTIIYQIKIKN